MSKDRSIATDALEVLGTLITNKEVGRDAIHLACLPAVCGDNWLAPGADVGLVNGEATINSLHIGIVDPFLKVPVLKGQKFLVVIYPRTITSLRHVWSHPDIAEDAEMISKVDPREEARIRLDEIARSLIDEGDDSLDYLICGMEDGYIQDGGRFEGMCSIEIPTEAWSLYETYTGRKIKPKEDVYFSCSC
jgi:hypothetical protein